MKERRLLKVKVTSVASLLIVIAGCSSPPAPEAQSDEVTREALPAAVVCGTPSGFEQSAVTVTVNNETNALITVIPSAIDCYDWYGEANPSKLAAVLMPGPGDAAGESVSALLKVLETPQAANRDRPWDMTIMYQVSQSTAIGGKITPRPNFKPAQEICNSAGGGTACAGMSLCAGGSIDSYSTIPLKDRTLKVRTVCSLAGGSMNIIISE